MKINDIKKSVHFRSSNQSSQGKLSVSSSIQDISPQLNLQPVSKKLSQMEEFKEKKNIRVEMKEPTKMILNLGIKTTSSTSIALLPDTCLLRDTDESPIYVSEFNTMTSPKTGTTYM